MITKLSVYGIGFVFALVIWQLKIRASRRHLATIEAGNACMACEGIDVTREARGVRCNACGMLTTFELMRVPVSKQEIDDLTLPDGPPHR